jgi:hypothetical protein
MCIVWRGRPIFLELKAEHGRLSAVQRQVGQKLERAGAEVLVCRTLYAVQEQLRQLGVPLRASVG